MDFGFGAMAQGGMELTGRMHQEEMQDDQQAFADFQARQGMVNSAEQAKIQRDFQERMANTSWQRGVADMKSAGLNPMLAFSKGGADTPGGAMGQSFAGSSGIGSSSIHSGIGASMLVDAQEDLVRAQAENVRADTANKPIHGKQMSQQIEESKQKVEQMLVEMSKTRQDEATSGAQERLLMQQRRNMVETVQQIRATVQQLKSQTVLTGAEGDRVKQVVEAKLPELQRILMGLDKIMKEFQMPGHANRAAAAESFVGLLGEYIRSLMPFKDLFK